LPYFVFIFTQKSRMSLASALKAMPEYAPVILIGQPFKKLDFTAANTDLPGLDLTDTKQFSDYVFGTLLEDNHYIGVGGYNEHRVIYRRSAHFGDYADEGRCVHLGVDVWACAGTPVYAPLAGVVHSVAFNDNFGDYGPTLILQHQLSGQTFHTLYGHLSLASLEGIGVGQEIAAGERIAAIGDYPENGHWPPHLHFQIIRDMETKQGDYPGVAALSERGKYLENCPDPNLILRIPELVSPHPSSFA
jgi:peptidoglycan LD-endopeptidase LytH